MINLKKNLISAKYIKLIQKSGRTHLLEDCQNISINNKKNLIILKIKYSSINYRDYLAFKGNLAVARKYPYVPGVDLVGIVEKSNSSKFFKGDRIAALALPTGVAFPGAWSTYCQIHSNYIFKLPKNWTYEDIISIGTAGLAAASGISAILNNCKTMRNKSFHLLVTGATGGVGTIACLLGKMLGWKVSAVTRNPNKNKHYFKSIGLENIINAKNFISSPSFNLLSTEYDAAIESVGGEYLSNSVRKLKNNGVCAIAGLVSSQDMAGLTVLPFLMRGVSLIGTGAEILNNSKKKNAFNLIKKLIKKQKLKNIITKINFSDIKRHLNNWEKKKIPGRIIIKL